MKVLVAGATGEVGKCLAHEFFQRPEITEIHLILRRPVLSSPKASPVEQQANQSTANTDTYWAAYQSKLVEHVVGFDQLNQTVLPQDFASSPSKAFCCLGTTIKAAGSKQAFQKVDLDYVVAFAELAKDSGCDHFSVVSSIGANESSNNFYLHTKGKMEQALMTMNWPSLNIFRPSLLLAKRKDFRLGEELGALAMKALNPLLIGPLSQYRAIKTQQVAKAMISHALDGKGLGIQILKNREMNQL